MEGAARVFAGDFSGSTLSVPGEDAGSPAWVVTPGGASCRLVYLCGALTEVFDNGGVLHCRLADPTGAFDIVSGGRNTTIAKQVQEIPVPSFIAVTGTAQIYKRNGGWAVSVRPDYIKVIDRVIRDRWISSTADMTISRLELLLDAMLGHAADPRATDVVQHYALTKERIRDMVAMVQGALESVQAAPPPAPTAEADISCIIMEIIKEKSGPRGIAVEEVQKIAGTKGYSGDAVISAIRTLVENDDCYQPQKGYVKPL
ncbi:MAG TPA: hypothetical protein PKM50_07740 [Methanoregula sp.]|nr:hypothetical protein [Methanoregula sp.]